MKYRRVLLKLSGESLGGRKGSGFDETVLKQYAQAIAGAHALGLQLALVVGGGNIFRGLQGATRGFERPKGDQMGMLATVINALALSEVLTNEGVVNSVYTATPMMPIAEHYSLDAARAALESGRVIFIAGGTGNPFFTTDSAAALRAAELRCDALLKGTRVDGVYNDDPEKNPAAVRYDRISFTEALNKQLRIMDQTAFTLCQENRIPIVVFDMNATGNLERLARGESLGTVVTVG